MLGHSRIPIRPLPGRPRLTVPRRTTSPEPRQLLASLEAVGFCAYYKNARDVIVYATPRIAELLGRPLDEIEGQTAEHLFPYDHDRMCQEDQQVLAARRPLEDLFEPVGGSDGKPLWIEIRKLPHFDSDGAPIGIVVIARDVHEHSTGVERVLEVEREAPPITEEAPVGIFRVDREGSCVYATDDLCAFAGVRREEVLGDGWLRTIHEDDHARIMTNWQTAQESGCLSHRTEARVLRSDGRIRHAIVHMVAEIDDGGRITGYVGSLTDVTSRRQLDERLQRTERRFAALAALAPVGIYRSDAQGRTLFVNDHWCELAGISPEQARGFGWLDALHPDDREAALHRLAAATESAHAAQAEFRLLRPDGSTVWVMGDFVAERDHDGHVVGYLGTVTDISEMRAAVEEIKRLNEDLEDRVRRRTSELEASNKELESFCYAVSHDLRSPLRSIDGFSQSVLDRCGDQLGAEARAELGRVRYNAQRMGRLIDELLTLSRLTRSRLVSQRVDLSALAHEAIAYHRKSEPARRVRVVIQDQLVVSGDPELLRNAIDNLIDNAWKFSAPRAEARIELGATTRPDGEGHVYFVRDNGVGFDMTYAGKLFRAFQRLHGADEFEGSGIGLATVDRIIKRHGGRVWCDGALDKGATFFFTLPRSAGQESEPFPAA